MQGYARLCVLLLRFATLEFTYIYKFSLACDTADKLKEAVTTMDATFLRWGLTISTKKTKVLVVGRNAAAQAANSVITLRGDPLEVVSHFK